MNKPNTKHIDFDKIVRITDTGVDEQTGNVWMEFKTIENNNGCNIGQKAKKRN